MGGKSLLPDRSKTLVRLLELNVLCNNAQLKEEIAEKKSRFSRGRKDGLWLGIQPKVLY